MAAPRSVEEIEAEMERMAAERRKKAEGMFYTEGGIGAAIGGAGFAAFHVIAERVVPPYHNLNWRAKLFMASAAVVSGFTIRSELKVLEQREKDAHEHEEWMAKVDNARMHRR